tara:strand:+ start:523 stop:720 length:198 start_codon:yes stop_codon:yes gene_type:complete
MLYKTVKERTVKEFDYEVEELLARGFVLFGKPKHFWRHRTGYGHESLHIQTLTYSTPSTGLLTED